MAEDSCRNSYSPTRPDATPGSTTSENEEDDNRPREDREMDMSTQFGSKKMPEGKMTFFVYVLSFFAAIGGFLFGYDTGVVSGASLQIQKYYELDDVSWELIVSITIAGAAVGAALGGPVNEYLGRRWTMIVASVVFTVGAGCMAASPKCTWKVLLTGRLIIGLGIGKFGRILK